MKKALTSTEFWQELYYIRLRSDSKMPAESWGGYDQDFRTSDQVYRWEDLGPNHRYGYIAHKKYDLAVVDIDLYKDGAPDVEDITIFDPDGNGVLVIQTPSGGFHVPFLTVLDENTTIRSTSQGIDIKGEAAKGHVVLPKHNSKYEILNDSIVPIFDKHEADQIVRVNDDSVLTFRTSGSSYDGPTSSHPLDTYLARFEEDYVAGENSSHPIHGSDTGSNFRVDDGQETWRCWRHNVTGNLLHLVGIEEGYWDCGGWIRLDPDDKSRMMKDLEQIARRRGYIGEEPRNIPSTP